jgi:hypothetical protein
VSSTPHQVFISYSHADSEFVNRFAALLLSYDLNVWKDSKDIPIGGNIPKVIYQGIKDASHFCCIISNSSVMSTWVEEELSFAKIRQLGASALTIIPILIDNIEVPDYVQAYRYANLRDRNLSPNNVEVGRILAAFGIVPKGLPTHVILGPDREKLLASCRSLGLALFHFRDRLQPSVSLRSDFDKDVASYSASIYQSDRRLSQMYPESYKYAHGPDVQLDRYIREKSIELQHTRNFIWTDLKTKASHVLESIDQVDKSGNTVGLDLLERSHSPSSEKFALWVELSDVLGNLSSLCRIVASGDVSQLDYTATKFAYFADSQKTIDNIVGVLESWGALERTVK